MWRGEQLNAARSVTVVLGLVLISLLLASLLSPLAEAQAGTPRVLVARLSGAITQASASYVDEAIAEAEAGGYDALVLELNTPGGGLSETEEIMAALTATSVPVLGYVSPMGAEAVSAGTIILEATWYAAMAPFATIGSVQPVIVGPSGFEPVTDSKIINYVVERLESVLDSRGRNVSLARAFVVDNLNLNASEAVAYGATETVAASLSALLLQADGVTTHFKNTTLTTAGAEIDRFSPSLRLVGFEILSDPFIASLLLVIGIYAVIFGVSAPGHGAEIGGAIMIILALIGLGFEISLMGVLLILIGFALFIIELKTPGFGAWGVGGIIAIVLGAFFVAPLRPPEFVISPDYQLTLLVMLLVPSAAFGGFLLFALYKIIQVRRRRPQIGGVVGDEAETTEDLEPGKRGYVLHEGELWQAESKVAIPKGTKVRIVAKEGVIITVEPLGEGEAAAGASPPASGEPKPP